MLDANKTETPTETRDARDARHAATLAKIIEALEQPHAQAMLHANGATLKCAISTWEDYDVTWSIDGVQMLCVSIRILSKGLKLSSNITGCNKPGHYLDTLSGVYESAGYIHAVFEHFNK